MDGERRQSRSLGATSRERAASASAQRYEGRRLLASSRSFTSAAFRTSLEPRRRMVRHNEQLELAAPGAAEGIAVERWSASSSLMLQLARGVVAAAQLQLR